MEPIADPLVLARERYALRDYHAVVLLLRDAVAAGQAYADAYHLLGLAYSLLDRPEDALAAFDAALARNPRYLEAQLNRAVLLATLGRESEAQEGFRRARELERRDETGFPTQVGNRLANAHASLGNEYRQAGAHVEAVGQYRRALSLRPRFPDVRLALARTLLDGGAHAEAASELEVVMAQRPDLVDAVVLRGLAAYLAGDLDSAERFWQRAAVIAPDEPRVDTYRTMLARRRAARA